MVQYQPKEKNVYATIFFCQIEKRIDQQSSTKKVMTQNYEIILNIYFFFRDHPIMLLGIRSTTNIQGRTSPTLKQEMVTQLLVNTGNFDRFVYS